MLGPWVETSGYVVLLFLLLTGWGSATYFGLFLMIALLFGAVLSFAAVGPEELSFRRYTRLQDLLWLLALSLLENLGYRQIILYYRLKGTLAYLQGQTGWGRMERKGFQTA